MVRTHPLSSVHLWVPPTSLQPWAFLCVPGFVPCPVASTASPQYPALLPSLRQNYPSPSFLGASYWFLSSKLCPALWSRRSCLPSPGALFCLRSSEEMLP